MTHVQNIVAAVALSAYFAIMFLFLAKYAFVKFRRVGFVFLLIAVGFLHSMASKKSIWTFDVGLHDNGSYSTNNTVVAKWTRDMQVPAAADLYVDYRLMTDTNGPWHTLIYTRADAMTATATLLGATNYNYFVWANYVPPQPVYTNGVWMCQGGKTKDGKNYLTVRGEIYDNGKKIATPERKMK